MALVYSSRVENKKKKKKSLLLLRFYNKCLKIEKHDLTIYFFLAYLFIEHEERECGQGKRNGTMSYHFSVLQAVS